MPKLSLKPIEATLVKIQKQLEKEVMSATGKKKKKLQSELKKLNKLILQVPVPCKLSHYNL